MVITTSLNYINTLELHAVTQSQVSQVVDRHSSIASDFPFTKFIQLTPSIDRTPPQPLFAQDIPNRNSPLVPPQSIPQSPLPTQTLPETQPELTPETRPQPTPEVPSETIFVTRFEIEGRNSEERLQFDSAILAEVARRGAIGEMPDQTTADPNNCPEVEATNTPVNHDLSFAAILAARSAITAYYVCRGYTTSGAIIPAGQVSRNGVVKIQVIEGRLEDDGIVIEGTRRLRPAYVRDRLALVATQPLNVNHLLDGLRLLQLDPLIQSVSADLQTGTRPGTNRLVVKVQEADSFSIYPSIDNNRSPSVGSFRRQIEVGEANLLGFGDGLSVSYANTDGSNQVDASYAIPLNPHNGTLRLAFGFSDSEVIEPPFDVLNIESNSHYYELSFRQPLIRFFTESRGSEIESRRARFEELALGVAVSQQESQAEFSPAGETLAFPSLGADAEGRTKISALRFFQDWTQQGNNYVLAARSQFSLGLEALDATVNETGPDSRFLAWRGQGQWVRVLAPEMQLLVRSSLQFADAPLLPQEQFSLGGQDTVRGYRQDFLLTDNGAFLSAEVQVPVVRLGRNGVVKLVPFVDMGMGWNSEGENPDPNTLASIGLGLLWRQTEDFAVRLDWGLPLVDDDARDRTWQESGFYFSLLYSPF